MFYLCVDQGETHRVEPDERSKPSSDVGELGEDGLHEVIAADEVFFSRSVDNISGPHQWHPVLGHCLVFLIHFLKDFSLTLHHDTYKATETKSDRSINGDTIIDSRLTILLHVEIYVVSCQDIIMRH